MSALATAPVTTIDLTKEAVLLRLEIGQVGVTARSRTLTAEAAVKHDADPDSVRGIVQILTGASRAPITQQVNAARILFEASTLSWDNKGYRLCPADNYGDLMRGLDARKNLFHDAVDDLGNKHAELRKDYHQRVKDLAHEVPFPSERELRDSFRFDVYVMPLANPDDIRLRHVNGAALEAMKQSVAAQYDERLADTGLEIVERLQVLVARVKEQCGKENGRLFDSLIGNIEDAVEVCSSLNITNNPEITRLIERVKLDLTSIDIPTIRDDKSGKLRKETAKVASNVLRDLQKFGL